MKRPEKRRILALAAISGLVAGASAQVGPVDPISLQPLVLQEERQSVYAPPTPPRDDQGINQGAVHLELTVTYLTDYVFRGIERFEFDPDFPRDPESPPAPPEGSSKEDLPNVQFNGRLSFDLGKLPSPFVELFVNAAEEVEGGDRSFQEIRPTVGLDWNVRPFLLSAGNTNYIFLDTGFDVNGVPESAEVFARLVIDDSYFLGTEKPLLSPYIFAAYDYDEYDGLYVEAGVDHKMEFEDTGLTLTFHGHVAYVTGLSELYGGDRGFQHYQVGVMAEYSLNTLFNFSTRYGEWSLRGYLNYTGDIDEDLRADQQMWGGAGIGFRY